MFKKIADVPSWLYVGVITALLIAVGLLWVQYIQQQEALQSAQQDIDRLEAHVRSAEVRLDDAQLRIEDYEEQLALHKQLLGTAQQELTTVAQTRNELNEAVASAQQTADYLNKLKENDEELLAKYSKVYFLNEHYTPKQLGVIPVVHSYNEQVHEFHAQALPFLLDMLGAVKRANVDMQVVSAYRSFDYQTQLKGRYVQTYGSGANAFSADQGYSEHQLGTAVDFTAPQLQGMLEGFENTTAYSWLMQNAHKYGFTLSYPQNNAYYVFEPWHWRFVGVELATYLKNNGMQFYDIPQRDLEVYRTKIFE